MITDPRRAERYIRRRWGRLLKEVIYFDIPNLNGWMRYWFAIVTFDEEQFQTIPVLTQSYLTTPTGSLQNTNGGVDATWNNSNNKIECIGGGATGAVSDGEGSSDCASGGGGGSYSKITNFTIASPGTTTFQWELATGGAQVQRTTLGRTNGNVGNSTWWNSATDPGVGADNTKCSAAGGTGGTAAAAAQNGGAGGLTTASWGTTKNAGGNGGNASAANTSTGGGGAAGPNGAGVNGAAVASGAGAGGNADNSASGAGTGSAGASGSTTQTSSAGGNGTELGDSTHGCGGGSGGARTTTGAGGVATSGVGGKYGGGTGGAFQNASTAGTMTAGAGGQGIIVLTWTPASSGSTVPLRTIMGIGR